MANTLLLIVDKEVIDFVKYNIESLKLNDPIPVLIYGKFSDEKENQFRISIQEKSEFKKYNKNNGAYIGATGIPDIFVDKSFENIIKNKTMILVNDTVKFK